MTEGNDEQVEFEATSNPVIDNNDRASEKETNEENDEDEEHFELNEDAIDEEKEIAEGGNIDEGPDIRPSLYCEADDGAKSHLDENDEELLENEERQFQQSLDNLGVISAHHDGYIRFWNYEVHSVSINQ